MNISYILFTSDTSEYDEFHHKPWIDGDFSYEVYDDKIEFEKDVFHHLLQGHLVETKKFAYRDNKQATVQMIVDGFIQGKAQLLWP